MVDRPVDGFGTVKFLPQRPHRTILPRMLSGTCRALRHRRLGQITVTAILDGPQNVEGRFIPVLHRPEYVLQ